MSTRNTLIAFPLFIIIFVFAPFFELYAQTWIHTELPDGFEAQEVTNSGQVEGIKDNKAQIYSKNEFFNLTSNGSPVFGTITKTTKSGFRLVDTLNLVDTQRRKVFSRDYPNSLTGTIVDLDFLAEDINDFGDVVGRDEDQAIFKRFNESREVIPFPQLTVKEAGDEIESLQTNAINDKREVFGAATTFNTGTGITNRDYAFKYANGISTQLTYYEWWTNRERATLISPLTASDSGYLGGFVNTEYGFDARISDAFGFPMSYRASQLRDNGIFQDVNSNDIAVGGVVNIESYRYGGTIWDGALIIKDYQPHFLNMYYWPDQNESYIKPKLENDEWLTEITSINDCGEIIVRGDYAGGVKYHLLSPPDIGYVFAPDPITTAGDLRMHPGLSDLEIEAQRICVKLQLDNSDGRLTTDYVAENTDMNDSKRHYDYAWDSDKGYYVSGLYYTDLAARYFVDTLGFSSLRQFKLPISFDTAEITAFEIPKDGSAPNGIINFSKIYSNGVSTATDAEVVFHENAHLFIQQVAPGFIPRKNPEARLEPRAIGEAVSDIFAANAFATSGPRDNPDFNSLAVATWAGYNPSNPPTEFDPAHPDNYVKLGLRRFDGNKRYPEDFFDDKPMGHENSASLSAALWEIRQIFVDNFGENFARNLLDKFIFNTVHEIHKARESGNIEITFRRFARKFLNFSENYALNHIIRPIFISHGILLDIKTLNNIADTYNPGEGIQGQVELTGLAPRENATIDIELIKDGQVISTISPEILFLNKIGEFNINAPAVDEDTVFELRATYDESIVSKQIIVKPEGNFSLRLSRQKVVGGVEVNAVISVLNADRNNDTVISLTSSDSKVSLPSQVVIPKRKKNVSFKISTRPSYNPYQSEILATSQAGNAAKSLSVVEVKLKKVSASPTSVFENHTTFLTIELNGKAPAGNVTVQLSSNKPELLAVTPSAVVIPENSTFAQGLAVASDVSKIKAARITGIYGTDNKGVRILIEPEDN